MSHNGFDPKSADTRRAENTALAGMGMHLLFSLILLTMSFMYAARSYSILWVQCSIGILFYLASFLSLRLRRLAITEELDRDEMERQRKSQGLGSLFEADEQGQAVRNFHQYNKYIAPVLSVLFALALLAFPALLSIPIITGATTFKEIIFGNMPLAIDRITGVAPLIMAFLLFILGAYGAGLCKASQWRAIRTGAGYSLSSAAFMGLSGLFLLLGDKIGFYPERSITILVCIWITLQAVEILMNLILDHYRPRLPDIEQRQAYDSRLSGLLAEPQGVFKTFAHTLDYQFGFQVSDTWFFQFVEKAFAPLIVITFLSFYLLSCLVVVHPGQAAVIERFGAPRGSTGGEIDWAEFAKENPPLYEGMYLKWPWPIETAKVVNNQRLSQITVGFGSVDEKDSRRKADELREKMAEWDTEHVEDEYLYISPLPVSHGDKRSRDNYALISGCFMVEYSIGNDAMVYEYLYNFRDSQAMLRAIAEKEVTSFMGGQDFWDILSRQSNKVRTQLLSRISAQAKKNRLGITINNIGISTLHPPAGEVGKEFLNVIASRQKKQVEIYKGQEEAIRIKGMAPAQAKEVTSAAQAYKFRREAVSKSEALWFINQLTAYAAAPTVYREFKQMQMLENALSDPQKIILPQSATLIMDDSKAADPDNINKLLARQIEKLNAGN